jgi:hypothetical protein
MVYILQQNQRKIFAPGRENDIKAELFRVFIFKDIILEKYSTIITHLVLQIY